MILGRVAAGLLLVLLDLRFDGVDVVPDVIGWAIVLVALRRIGSGDPTASPLLWAVAVVGLLSLGDLVRVPVVGPVYDLGLAAVLVLLANYLAIRAARADDVPAEKVWLRLRNVILFLAAAGVGLGVFGGSGPLAQLGLVYLIGTLATAVAVEVALLAHRTRDWARPAGGA